MGSSDMSRKPRLGFGVTNLVVAVIVGLGVFRGLPARWLPLDIPAAIVVLLLAASGVTLLLNHARAPQITRIAGIFTLACGLVLFAMLVITASWLSGIYGTSGKGFGAIYGLIALLVLPYLVVYPAALLAWARS